MSTKSRILGAAKQRINEEINGLSRLQWIRSYLSSVAIAEDSSYSSRESFGHCFKSGSADFFCAFF